MPLMMLKRLGQSSRKLRVFSVNYLPNSNHYSIRFLNGYDKVRKKGNAYLKIKECSNKIPNWFAIFPRVLKETQQMIVLVLFFS